MRATVTPMPLCAATPGRVNDEDGKRLKMNAPESSGFVVIATGTDDYIKMAKGLARSLEWAGMLSPRAVITNRADTDLQNFYHQVIVERTLPNSYQAKLSAVDLSPYDEMVFIDVDCLVYERFRLPAELRQSPFAAFGEKVINQDWFGLTPEFVRSLRVRRATILQYFIRAFFGREDVMPRPPYSDALANSNPSSKDTPVEKGTSRMRFFCPSLRRCTA